MGDDTLRSSFVFLFLFVEVIVVVATEQNVTNAENWGCLPAEPRPLLNFSGCFPLENFTKPFCEEYGIHLPEHVFKPVSSQEYKNNQLRIYTKMSAIVFHDLNGKITGNIQIDKVKLGSAFLIYFCHGFFPPCDATSGVFQEMVPCKETCLSLIRLLGKQLYELTKKIILADKPYYEKLVTCETQPERNAGESPECWYYDFNDNGTSNQALQLEDDCLYLNGSTYNGNISVTASGLSCQSWTSQCPHRHTMNTTYPELNTAQNYCRNPKNSGKLPWCFTNDRGRRWEYCDIPKCKPVDGGYGDWYLITPCSALCGDGFETWGRNCTNPSTRYGGKTCSSLGNATEQRKCSRKPCIARWSSKKTGILIAVTAAITLAFILTLVLYRRKLRQKQVKACSGNRNGAATSTHVRICWNRSLTASRFCAVRIVLLLPEFLLLSY